MAFAEHLYTITLSGVILLVCPTHGGFTMKSSRDCQIIIGITTQILVRDVCLIPKYDTSSLPRDSVTQLIESTHFESG